MTDDDAIALMKSDVHRVARQAQYKYGVDAGDVMQEAWILILRAVRDRGDELTHPRTYLFNYIRRAIGIVVRFNKYRASHVDVDDCDIEAPSHSDGFLTGRGIFAGLTPDRLKIIANIYCNGMIVADIAKEVGKSRQSVDQAHKLAIKRIRRNMGVES